MDRTTSSGGGNRRRTARKLGRPVCLATGKIRYRDGHDAALALRSMVRRRSRAEADGAAHRIQVQRKYACPACGGWHLTSQKAPAFTRIA